MPKKKELRSERFKKISEYFGGKPPGAAEAKIKYRKPNAKDKAKYKKMLSEGKIDQTTYERLLKDVTYD
jgi:hypothetical protein